MFTNRMKRLLSATLSFTLVAMLLVTVLLVGCAKTPTSAPTPAPTVTKTATATVTATSTAAPKAEYDWLLGHPYAAGSSYDLTAQVFADIVQQRSGGRIKIKIVTGGALGSVSELTEKLMSGDLPLALPYPYTKYSKKFDVMNLPFAFTTLEQVSKAGFGNGIVARLMKQAYGEIGILRVFTRYAALFGLLTKKGPIRTPDDLKGVKIGMWSAFMFEKMHERMGAVVAIIDTGERYTALQTGVIDGVLAYPAYALERKWVEQAKHYVDLGQAFSVSELGMNLKLFNSLPKDLQNVITEAGKFAEDYSMGIVYRDAGDAKEMVKEKGVTITTLTPEQKQLFIDKVKPEELIKEALLPVLGEATFNELISEVVRIRAIK